MAQTTEQAFADLPRTTGKYRRIQSDIKILAGEIERLEELEAEILDDVERKAAVKKLIDMHPVLTVTKVVTAIQKLKDLRAHLADNNFL